MWIFAETSLPDFYVGANSEQCDCKQSLQALNSPIKSQVQLLRANAHYPEIIVYSIVFLTNDPAAVDEMITVRLVTPADRMREAPIRSL